MTDVSIVLCTYNRPALFKAALEGCLRQSLPGGRGYEVVVVDNSPDGNARAAVETAKARSAVPVRYVALPRPNIAEARNAGVRAAGGRYVAFVDDDEEPGAEWLRELLATAEATGADMVFGPVEPVFEAGGPPAFDPGGGLYRRGLNLPDRAAAAVHGEHGHASSLGAVGTCNALVRRECFGDRPAFDPAFGRTGGEDSDFFRRQIRAGRKAAWSAKAVVTEWIPEDRADLDFMVRRRYRESQTHVRVLVKNGARPRLVAANQMLRGAAQLLLWIGPLTCARLLPERLVVRARFQVAAGRGKLSWRRPARAGDPLYN